MTPPARITGYLVAGAIALLLVGVVQHYRNAAARERLLRLNVEAQADTTQHFLRGQLQVATRLAVQTQLAHQAVATVTIRVPGATVTRVDTLRMTDTLRAQLDTNGVHVRAVVALVPPPPTWTWTLQQDPRTYRVTFEGCHDHAARVTVEGPRWQAVQLVDLKQDPNICNPAPGWRLFSVRAPGLPVAAALVGLGYLLAK